MLSLSSPELSHQSDGPGAEVAAEVVETLALASRDHDEALARSGDAPDVLENQGRDFRQHLGNDHVALRQDEDLLGPSVAERRVEPPVRRPNPCSGVHQAVEDPQGLPTLQELGY